MADQVQDGAFISEVATHDLVLELGLYWPGKVAARQILAEPPRGVLHDVLSPPRPMEEGTGHRLIVGDNLAALRLLMPELRARVRMIYIDPPYNTGQRFAFADRFTTPRRVAGADRRVTRAQAHSTWLSMMYPRLILAHQLLRADGAIFISIGHEEIHHLLCLLHEIFGEACFKNIIVIRRGVKNVQAQFATVDALQHGHEYVVFFAREPTTRFPKLIIPPSAEAAPPHGTWNNHWRGTDRPTMRYPLFGIVPERGQWRWGAERSQRACENYARCQTELGAEWPPQPAIDSWVAAQPTTNGVRCDLLRLSRTGKPEHYVPPSPGKLASDLWTDLAPNGSAALRQIFGGVPLFETPKSPDLIRRLIRFATDPGDTILDFFAGTCTTMQAVMQQNATDSGARHAICIQSPDPLPRPVTLEDGTTLATIADIGLARVRRVRSSLGLLGSEIWVQSFVED